MPKRTSDILAHAHLPQVYVWARRNQYVHMSLLGIFTFTVRCAACQQGVGMCALVIGQHGICREV